MKRLLSVLRLVAITAFVGLPTYFGPYGGEWTSYNYGDSRGVYSFAQYPQKLTYKSQYHEYSVANGDYTNIAYRNGWGYGKGYGYFGSGSI